MNGEWSNSLGGTSNQQGKAPGVSTTSLILAEGCWCLIPIIPQVGGVLVEG